MIDKIVEKIPHTFMARYGLSRHLYKISDNSYIMEGNSNFSRGAEGVVDFEGGPYIEVGMPLSYCCDIANDKSCGIKIEPNETVKSVRLVTHADACQMKGISTYTDAPESYCYAHITTNNCQYGIKNR